MPKCDDCELELLGLECEGKIQPSYDANGIKVSTLPGHPGMCCDCFDQLWGMPDHYRSRLRPGASTTDQVKHAVRTAKLAVKRSKRIGAN